MSMQPIGQGGIGPSWTWGNSGGAGMGSMFGGFGGAIGDIFGGIGSLFEKNPANAAMQYYNQIPGYLNQYLSPYINQGNQAYGTLQGYMNNGAMAGGALAGQYGRLLNNPASVMNQIGAGFHASPGYQWDVNQALSGANRAAAAGGMAGSPMEQQNMANISENLANQNYYNYVGQGLGEYNNALSGLQGMYGMGGQIGQNIYGQGAMAGRSLAEDLAQAMAYQGQLAYNGQINQNQSMMGGLGALGSGIGSIVSSFF